MGRKPLCIRIMPETTFGELMVVSHTANPGWHMSAIMGWFNAGFKAEKPTVWIAEGLLNYFTQEQNDALLQHMHKVSFLACSVP